MPIWINDNSTPRNLSSVFVNDNGTVRDLQKIWINDNGSVRLVFSKGVLSPAETTFYEFVVALEDTLGDNVISAGPISSSTKAEGVAAGTWEIILAPGYSFGGTNTVVGTYNNDYSARYLFTVQVDGTSTALASSPYEQFKGGNFTVNYADAEAFAIIYDPPTGLAGFPHRATWGNTSTGSPTNAFRWTVPAVAVSPSVFLIGGGGGGGSGSFYGGSNSSWGGGGGGGGAYSSLPVVAGTTYTMAIGLGGAGGIMSWAGINSGASGAATTVTGINSAAAGGGGVRGEDGVGPGTGGGGGSPNGAAGGAASPDYNAGIGYNGANSGAGGAGGLGGTGDGFPQGGNGGGGGGGFDNGGEGGGASPTGRFSTRGGGGGGGAGEFSGGRGGDGYIQFTWS